jgi:DNA-binding phage protein
MKTMARRAKHVHRQLTAEERAKIQEARRLIGGEEAEIRHKARQYQQEHEAAQGTLREALHLLKRERERQGLSLADVESRSGIGRPNLSRLENEAEANPTVATLARYAEALGKKLVVALADRD